jgi:hypothetical protein
MVVGGSDRGISEEGGEGELSGVADKRAGWKENSTVPMVKRKKTRTKKNSAR